MDPVLPAFAAVAQTVTFGAPRLPLISNVTGRFFEDGAVPDAAYWTTHVRDAVRFADGVQALERAGYTTVLEVGPAPALSGMARRVTSNQEMAFVPSLKKEQRDWRMMLDAAGALYRAGATIDWDAVDRGFGFVPVSLPTYPFERERYWIDPGAPTLTGVVESRPQAAAASPAGIGDPVAAHRYAVQWEAAALPNPNPSARQGSWIVIGAADRFSEMVERHLRAAEATVRIADCASLARAMMDSSSPTRVVLIPPSRADWARLDDAHSLRADLRSSCEPMLQAAHALTGADVTLVVITRHAQSTTAGEDVDVSHAAVWGTARALRAEHPELRSRLIDVASDSASDGDTLWRALASNADELAVRGSAILAPRLRPAAQSEAPPIRHDRSYLITGGFGALGAAVARGLVRRGARYVALVGRSTQSDAAVALLQELKNAGATAQAVAGDVSDSATVARAVDTAARMAPLCGVVHTAGVNADAAFAQQDWPRFEQVMAAKVIGAWHLHNATRNIALDWFTCFSSSAALLPTIGQANYAAANAALDAIAYRRRAAHLPAVSINWGPWDEVGMAARLSARNRDRWQEHGISLIQPQDGVRLFEQITGAPTAQVAVLPIAWERFFTHAPEQGERQLLAGLRPGAHGQRTVSLAQTLAALPPSERRRALHTAVCDIVRGVLAVSPEFVFEPHQGLRDLGLDSLMAVELRNALQFRCGAVLPSTIAFDCPDIEALTACVAGILDAGAQFSPAPPEPISAIAREVEELSDQDAEALLAQELER
jgi:acyl transferase domain-containing protein